MWLYVHVRAAEEKEIAKGSGPLQKAVEKTHQHSSIFLPPISAGPVEGAFRRNSHSAVVMGEHSTVFTQAESG